MRSHLSHRIQSERPVLAIHGHIQLWSSISLNCLNALDRSNPERVKTRSHKKWISSSAISRKKMNLAIGCLRHKKVVWIQVSVSRVRIWVVYGYWFDAKSDFAALASAFISSNSESAQNSRSIGYFVSLSDSWAEKRLGLGFSAQSPNFLTADSARKSETHCNSTHKSPRGLPNTL